MRCIFHKWSKWRRLTVRLADGGAQVDAQDRTCDRCGKYQREFIG